MSLGPAKSSNRPNLRRLHLAILLIVAAELLFWAYTFYFIGRHTDLHGDGLEVIAMIPMSAIAVFIAFPALLLALFRQALWLALCLALLAAAADVVVWTQIVHAIGIATSGG